MVSGEVDISPLSTSAPGFFDVQISTDTPAIVVAVDQILNGNAVVTFDGETCRYTTVITSGNSRLVRCMCETTPAFSLNAVDGRSYNLDLKIRMGESTDITVGTISASVCPGYSSHQGICSGSGTCAVDSPDVASSLSKCTCASDSLRSGSSCHLHVVIPGIWNVTENVYPFILMVGGALGTSILLLTCICSMKICCPQIKSSAEEEKIEDEDDIDIEHSVNPMPITTTGIRFDKL